MSDNKRLVRLNHLNIIKNYIDKQDSSNIENLGVVTDEQGTMGMRVINGKFQYKNGSGIWTDIVSTGSSGDNSGETEITDTSYYVTFRNLDTVDINAVWDKANARLEF